MQPNPSVVFKDRRDAGHRLARRLAEDPPDRPFVLAVPPGGLVVAEQIANALDAPFEALPIARVRSPTHDGRELGTVGPEDVTWLDEDRIRREGHTQDAVEARIEDARRRLDRALRDYRDRATLPDLSGHTAILVDEGVIEGGTMRAAVDTVRHLGAERVIVAVPVARSFGRARVEPYTDWFIALSTRDALDQLEAAYEHLPRVPRDEARRLVGLPQTPAPDPLQAGFDETRVNIRTGDVELDAFLAMPDNAIGVTLLADDLEDPLNRTLADRLRGTGVATLRLPLLTEGEAQADAGTREHRYDIDLLTQRILPAIDWLRRTPSTSRLPLALAGAATGAAASIQAAGDRPASVQALASIGGRIDLAYQHLEDVRAPTLMVAADADDETLKLHRAALKELGGTATLHVLEDATDPFSDERTREEAAKAASRWIHRWLSKAAER